MSFFLQQGPVGLLFAFVLFHALADFPLQGEYLATHKSRRGADRPGDWVIPLTAHSVIQAGGVWLVSGSLVLAGAELILHFGIDFAKGEGKFGLVTDQTLHLACKLAFTVLIVMGGVGATGGQYPSVSPG